MARHTRGFALHVIQHSDRPGVVTWMLSRSLWRVGSSGRQDWLGRGEFDLEAGQATPEWTAEVLLTAALAHYRAKLEAQHPEDHP